MRRRGAAGARAEQEEPALRGDLPLHDHRGAGGLGLRRVGLRRLKYSHPNPEDNWIIACTNGRSGEELRGAHTFELIHESTDKRLRVSRFHKYSFSNWENCPCDGQLEVSAVDSPTKETLFQIVGVLPPPLRASSSRRPTTTPPILNPKRAKPQKTDNSDT